MNKEELEKAVEKADKAIELSRFAMKEGAETLCLLLANALQNNIVAQNLTNCIIRDIECGRPFDEILNNTKRTIGSIYSLPTGSIQKFYECVTTFMEGYSRSFNMCVQMSVMVTPIRKMLDSMNQ